MAREQWTSGRPAAAGLHASKADLRCGYLSQTTKACFAGGASKETMLTPRIQCVDLAQVPPNTSIACVCSRTVNSGKPSAKGVGVQDLESRAPLRRSKDIIEGPVLPLGRGPVGPSRRLPTVKGIPGAKLKNCQIVITWDNSSC